MVCASAAFDGGVADGPSGWSDGGFRRSVSLSGDGRFVAFHSDAANLVPEDTNGTTDIFVRDLETQHTERVNRPLEAAEADGLSENPILSADGRFVAFESVAANLVPGDLNGVRDVFVYDRVTQVMRRASVSTNGAQLDRDSSLCAVSADGRYLVFTTRSAIAVADDTNDQPDVFLRDLAGNTTRRVNVSSDGAQALDDSCRNAVSGYGAAISDGARFVAFWSGAGNLSAGDSNSLPDTFLHHTVTQRTTRLSVAPDGRAGDGASGVYGLAISGDGRYVAFESRASNLVAGDTNGWEDVFLRDTLTGLTQRISVGIGGAEGNFGSRLFALSADGMRLAFSSYSSSLVSDDANGAFDIFVHDWPRGEARRVRVTVDGAEPNGASGVYGLAISGDGRYVAFESRAGNLVAGDTNNAADVFVVGPLAALFQPYTVEDAAMALGIAAGLQIARPGDLARLDLVRGGHVDVNDAVEILKQVHRLPPAS